MIQPLTPEMAQAQIPILEDCCRVRPTAVDLATLGANYFTVGRTPEALPLLRVAWEHLKVSSIGMNLALVLKDLGKHEEAFEMVQQAYFLDPDDFYIRMGYGEALLKAGFWRQAWPIYDNARPTQQGAALMLRLPGSVKEWDGGPLPEGHELIVINEGGSGDRFSYARWLPVLTKMGINWKFFPFAELFSFFERIFPRDQLVKDEDEINPTHWTTTFALPAKLNVTPTSVPAPLPLMATEEAKKKYTLNRVSSVPVIGLCWQAAELFQGGRRVRSLTEGQAMRLVCMTGDKVQWVNWQPGARLPYPVVNLEVKTWEDTAGLLANLDGLVTVDTGPMHLAGAMRVPMLTLLSGNSCWKFLRKGSRDIWYPNAYLLRNDGWGFENAIDQAVAIMRKDIFQRRGATK